MAREEDRVYVLAIIDSAPVRNSYPVGKSLGESMRGRLNRLVEDV